VKEKLGRVLAWLSALAALLLVALALDGVPSRTAEPSEASPFDPSQLAAQAKAVKSLARAPSAPDAAVDAPPPLTAWSLPLCEAPEKGARIFTLSMGASPTLFVWCKGGFVRVDLSLRAETPQAQKTARFPSRAELPGGVTAQDFDADGVLDLVLATAPPAQVLHRPGAGVFFLRGRKAGGYEPARALVEAPVSALAAVPAEDGSGAALLVLTRGDVSAQRSGELWLFAGGANMQRVAQQPLGLGPRDLVIARLGTGPERTVWSALPLAGRIMGVPLSSAGAGKAGLGVTQTVAFPGVQGLLAPVLAESNVLLARDAQDVKRVIPDAPAPTLAPWAERVNLGPGVVADLDEDSRPEALAVVDGGIVRVLGPGQAEPEELELSPQFQSVLDVTVVRDEMARERGVVLVGERDTKMLGLLLLPRPPWKSPAQLIIQRAEVAEPAEQAVVALE
jgi:hypothetical protein